MIEVLNIKKSYKHKPALKGIHFKLDSGDACAILGGNGAGKSTLIKSMMGLVITDDGNVHKQGYCAYLPEQPYLPLSMTSWQLIAHACRMHGEGSECVRDLLLEVKLKQDVWHKKLSSYSKGMRQRAALAYTLAGKPDWMILDEPMSGLDAMGRTMVIDLLQKRQKKGMGLLMCSHLVTDIVKLCKHVYIIVNGEVKEDIIIHDSSMDEADRLEQRLRYWNNDEILD